jgi:hypothetical protein
MWRNKIRYKEPKFIFKYSKLRYKNKGQLIENKIIRWGILNIKDEEG